VFSGSFNLEAGNVLFFKNFKKKGQLALLPDSSWYF